MRWLCRRTFLIQTLTLANKQVLLHLKDLLHNSLFTMPTFLKNRYVRFIGIAITVLIGGLILLFAVSNLLVSSTGLSSDSIAFAPSMGGDLQERQVQNSMMLPSPHTQSGYTSNLEA